MPKKQKKTQSSSGTDHDPEILRGLARGPWSLLWASEAEALGESLSGIDVYAEAPDAPKWANRWAQSLADAIVALNGNTSLNVIFQQARGEGFAKDRENFGACLGLQVVGAGVRWDDDLRGTNLKIRYPSSELYEGATTVDLRFIRE
jgi:hypothetical protein